MHRSSVALGWRRLKSRYNLIGVECARCGEKFYPPRSICPKCRRKSELKEVKLNPRGTIVTYTVIRAAPSGFEKQVPYPVAIIQLDDDGPRLTSQLVDCNPDELSIGKKVEACFRKIYEDGKEGVIQYGLKFRLVA